MLLDQLRGLADRHARDARIQWYTGALVLDLGRPREALALLENAQRLDAHVPEVAFLKAWAFFHMEDYERAGQECERALALGFVPRGLLALQGTAWTMQGRLQDARTAFERAVEQDPANPGTVLQLAIIRLALGDARAGREALDRCVTLSAKIAPLRDSILAAFAPGGRPERALSLVPEIQRIDADRVRLAPPGDR
jgi:tetratricopeptide (TPR) repeat protein